MNRLRHDISTLKSEENPRTDQWKLFNQTVDSFVIQNVFLSTLKKDISLFLFCALCDLKVISRALYSIWLAVTLLYLKARFYLQPYLLLPPPRLSIPSLFISLSLSLSLSPSFSLSHLSPSPTLISFLLSRIKCILFELVLVSCVGSWPLVRAVELMREHVLRH